MKKDECCKNCINFGWEIMVKGVESIPNPIIQICLIKNKRKSEKGWCKDWKGDMLYIKTKKG